jgi:hypothetical protein
VFLFLLFFSKLFTITTSISFFSSTTTWPLHLHASPSFIIASPLTP